MRKVLERIAVVVIFMMIVVLGISFIPRTIIMADEPVSLSEAKVDDGGSVRPFEQRKDRGRSVSPGMSLRDHIAVEAMTEIVRNWPEVVTDEILADTSKHAYDLSDLMIQRRSER